MMLSGRGVNAGEARRIGLVDEVVPEDQLDNAARAIVRHPPFPIKPGLIRRFCSTRFMRPLIADYLRRKIAKETERRHYPVPFAILDLWERFGGDQAAMFALSHGSGHNGEGIPPTEIDRIAMVFGMIIGPILLADAIGLDNFISVARTMVGHSSNVAGKRLEGMVNSGRLGIKNGRGFYRYENGKPVYHDKKRDAPPAADLEERLVLRLLNAALAALRERVTVDAELADAGIIFGAGFAPVSGGPLHYIGSAGINLGHGRLKVLEERYGSRFAPDTGWLKLLMPGCNHNKSK